MSEFTTPDDYFRQVQRAVEAPEGGNSISLNITADSTQEAKLLIKKIQQYQKQLRLIKKYINQDMKEIRAEFKKLETQVSPSFLSVLGGKGVAKSDAAKKKRALNAKKDDTLKPYENLKLVIDNLLLQLDDAKMEAKQFSTE